jgi:hypothetical protein
MTVQELHREISEFFKVDFQFGDKQGFLRFLSEQLSLSIPKSHSYLEIIDDIVNKNKEKEFCKLFESENFSGLRSVFRNRIILDFFSTDELRLTGYALLKGNYDSSTRSNIIESVSRKATETEIIDRFVKNNTEKDEKNVVQQRKKWIVGPLGLSKSVASRSWIGANELSKVLGTYLTSWKELHEFFSKAEDWKKLDWKESVKEPFYQSKGVQLIMTSFNDESIMGILNKLVDINVLEIDSVKKFGDIIVSPHGIFNEEYNAGYGNLVDLILNSFANRLDSLDITLKSEGLCEESVDFRVREYCLQRKPDQIIKTLFGVGPHLIEVARGIGLVSFRKMIDKEILLQTILLKLGFTLPPRLDGLWAYKEKLKKCKMQLENLTDEDQKKGLWNRTYSDTEKILRDLLLFFFSYAWESKLREYYEDDRKVCKLKEMIRKEFEIKKPFDTSTLGDLCALLSRTSQKIHSDVPIRKAVESIWNRTYMISNEDFERLNCVRSARTSLTGVHATTRKPAEPIKIISMLLEISENWSSRDNQKKVFPLMIRVKESKSDEFGMSTVTAVDEEGREWNLQKSGIWIRPEYAYYMLSETDRIAIEPILVQKIW